MMRPMTKPYVAAHITLPSVSYGPFRQIGALPWLMVAATMRVIAFLGGLVIAAGWGYLSLAWAGAALTIVGLAVIVLFGRQKITRVPAELLAH